MNNESLSFGTMNGYGVYDLDIPEPIFPRSQIFEAKKSNNLYTWIEGTHKRAEIKAGGNLVADFRDLINIQSSLPVGNKNPSEVTVTARPDTLSAKNILLHAGKINITDKLKATDGLNIISENDINLNNAALVSSNSLSMTAANNINALQGELKGKDVTIISRSGDIRFQSSSKPEYFNPDNTRKISSLEATGDLLLHAGKNILLRNIFLTKSHNISLTANHDK
ncbi:hypothetical protein [Photorhabdus hainanensis]|uniref:hypothetical protein n=1 Tax=Photorhabdus hainanensis TaxID=1004166 RepID=UPI001BD43CEA|nr:hypothetical protein [Photorhabdus hainanensis]MBS9433401.1 hypothetical protein [Photorhabdus hainanensis]